MRLKSITISLLMMQIAFTSSFSLAAKQKKAVAGSSSSVPDVLVHLDKDYCDSAWQYVYTDKGSMTADDPAPSTGASSNPPMAKKVDDPITFPWGAPSPSKVLTFSDPGGLILGQAEVKLAPDGSDAARLLVRTLAGSPEHTPCNESQPPAQINAGTSDRFSFANAAYYLIDIVRWQASVTNSARSYQVASDHWYLFDFSDAKASRRKFPYTFHPFVTSDVRIVGDSAHPEKTNVVFLAINLAPQDDIDWKTNVDISYKLHADKVIPANVQDLELLIGYLVGITPPAAARLEHAQPKYRGRYGAVLVANLRDLPAKLTSTMTATFKGSPTKAEPPYCANVDKALLTASGKASGDCQNESTATTTNAPSAQFAVPERPEPRTAARPDLLLASYGLHHANLSAEHSSEGQEPESQKLVPSKPASGSGSTTNANSPPVQQSNTTANCDPSTVKDPETGTMLQKPCTLTQTIQDEGLHHWDVSIAIPTPGYKETVFDSTNALMPKSVTRTNAYAMLDIAPWGKDFVNPPLFGIPHLMTGLPIAGKVFNSPFVGGLGEEVGLSKVFPFSARVFGGVVYNKEFRGAAQIPHRVWKVQYGIELSMTSAISKLKGSG